MWHSDEIIAGQDWKKEIEEHLKQADVILLLVSFDFLKSELCYDIEIQPAIERHKEGKARVIPVILRTCPWQHESFGHLKALPANGKPVKKWTDVDDAYNNIIEGIRKAIIKDLLQLDYST
jgi:hypothetical protein